MNLQRTRKPYPLAGEGGARSAPGEGSRSPKASARKLRASMTDAERKLWLGLRDRRLAGTKFRRQVPIGPFIVDFACYESRLVIEVDGGQHSGLAGDARRDRWFADNDFSVLRFWNNEVLANVNGVLERIAEIVGTPQPARATRGHPSPARREGKTAETVTTPQPARATRAHPAPARGEGKTAETVTTPHPARATRRHPSPARGEGLSASRQRGEGLGASPARGVRTGAAP
jgi:very-short-patch-repair endonuclease